MGTSEEELTQRSDVRRDITLARQFVPPDSLNYFDLEDPVSLARLEEPLTALRLLEGLVVIDEIQRQPGLFPILRVLADRRSAAAHCSLPDPGQRLAGPRSHLR